MPSTSVEPVVEEFLSRLRAMYAGGSVDAVAEMLADCVVLAHRGRLPSGGDVSLQILDGVTVDEQLQIDVALDRIEETSVRVHYDALVRGTQVAEGTVRYVCIDSASGRPTSLPTQQPAP